MQLRKLTPRLGWVPVLSIVLVLLPAVVGAQERGLPEGYGDARAGLIAAMAASDLDAIETLIDPEGRIVFSMEKNQTVSSLAQWLGSFRAMVEAGTLVLVEDEESISGGSDVTAWSFSRQKLSWSKATDEEPFATATRSTTEVWERRDGGWTLVHIHHGKAPVSDEAEE